MNAQSLSNPAMVARPTSSSMMSWPTPSARASPLTTSERDLTDAPAERGEFGTSDHAPTSGGDSETMCVNDDLFLLPREQVPFREMTDDERMNGACIGRRGNAKAHVLDWAQAAATS